MTWIFGSFLVTRVLWQAVRLWLENRAMTEVGVVKFNRCVTGGRPRDNHGVRFRQSAENQVSSKGHAADQRVKVVFDDTVCKGVQALAPAGSRKKIWNRKSSPLWVYVSPPISQLRTNCGPPFENKIRDVSFIKKCFVRSLNYVNHVWKYTTLCSMLKLLILLSKSPEFLMSELLIVPKQEDTILPKDVMMLWGADSVTEIIGRKRISGL